MIPIFLVPAIVRPYTAAGDLWPPARDNRSSVAGRLRCHQAAARLGSPATIHPQLIETQL